MCPRGKHGAEATREVDWRDRTRAVNITITITTGSFTDAAAEVLHLTFLEGRHAASAPEAYAGRLNVRPPLVCNDMCPVRLSEMENEPIVRI